MNMEHFQPLAVSYLLLVGFVTKVFSLPAIAGYQDQYDLMTKCTSNCDTKNPYIMYASPVADDVYQTNDLNANYPYPPLASVMPAFDYYPKLERIDEPHLDKDYEQRALTDSEFLDNVYAVMLDDINRESVEPRTSSSGSLDEDDARSAVAFDEQSMSPEIFRETEAALINILTGKRGKRAQYAAANNMTSFMSMIEGQKLSPDKLLAYLLHPQPTSFPQSVEQGRPFTDSMYQYYMPSSAQTQFALPPFNAGSFATKYDYQINTMPNATYSGYAGEPQKQYSFNSAYFPYPAPAMPMMPTIQPANPTEPMSYPPVYYAFPPSPYAMPPSPFSPGLQPPAYNSQNEASLYLQPTYTAALPTQYPPFRVWPMGSQYRPSPVFNYTTIVGGNSTRASPKNLTPSTNKRPTETNLLTKLLFDPLTEKKTNPRNSQDRRESVATGRSKQTRTTRRLNEKHD